MVGQTTNVLDRIARGHYFAINNLPLDNSAEKVKVRNVCEKYIGAGVNPAP